MYGTTNSPLHPSYHIHENNNAESGTQRLLHYLQKYIKTWPAGGGCTV